MSHTKFLAIFLPIALLLPLAALFIPDSLQVTYTNTVEVIALFTGSLLAYMVAVSYRKYLKTAFVFLALYLLIFGLAIIIIPLLERPLGDAFLDFVLVVQVLNYAMLAVSSVFIVRTVDVKKLNVTGWLLVCATLLVCFFVALYPPLSAGTQNISFQFIVKLAIRLVDAALVTALVPVIWMYVQYLKTQQQQSLTFTVIVAGIVLSTIFDFIFESLTTAFPTLFSPDSSLYFLIPEMIYMYGFSIITIGMFAHLKHDEWGFKAIEKALAG
jgi:hypothetical protein